MDAFEICETFSTYEKCKTYFIEKIIYDQMVCSNCGRICSIYTDKWVGAFSDAQNWENAEIKD